MKKVLAIVIGVLALGTFVVAQQIGGVTNDVLGAHLNYGRGCAGCHAPHSGANGNGYGVTDSTTGNIALWGQDASKLYGQTIVTGQFDLGKLSPKRLTLACTPTFRRRQTCYCA